MLSSPKRLHAQTSIVVELPHEKVLVHAAKIAMIQYKPILLNYYTDTKKGTAFLGEDLNKNVKILVKNLEEYTSPVQQIFQSNSDYLIVTENSIYIVSGNMKRKNINSSTKSQ